MTSYSRLVFSNFAHFLYLTTTLLNIFLLLTQELTSVSIRSGVMKGSFSIVSTTRFLLYAGQKSYKAAVSYVQRPVMGCRTSEDSYNDGYITHEIGYTLPTIADLTVVDVFTTSPIAMMGDNTLQSFQDQTLITDSRVIPCMIGIQEHYVVPMDLAKKMWNVNEGKRKIQPHMLAVVIQWMYDVCETSDRDKHVYYVAVNYMDRYMSEGFEVTMGQIQLLASTCIFLASKVWDVWHIHSHELVDYTDNSITVQDIYAWETKVLNALNWDMSVVSTMDFIEHIVARLDIDGGMKESIIDRASTVLVLCTYNNVYSMCLPSEMAVVCLCYTMMKEGSEWCVSNPWRERIESVLCKDNVRHEYIIDVDVWMEYLTKKCDEILVK